VAVKNIKYFVIAAGFFLLTAAFLNLSSRASETDDIKKHMTDLKSSIDYLSSRHVDTAAFLKKLKEIEKDIADYENAQTEGLLENDPSLKKMIDLNIDTLDRQIAEKTLAVKRLDVLYLVMLVFGAVTGIGFAFYIVVMYNKRK
jgi:hypothetical protein